MLSERVLVHIALLLSIVLLLIIGIQVLTEDRPVPREDAPLPTATAWTPLPCTEYLPGWMPPYQQAGMSSSWSMPRADYLRAVPGYPDAESTLMLTWDDKGFRPAGAVVCPGDDYLRVVILNR